MRCEDDEFVVEVLNEVDEEMLSIVGSNQQVDPLPFFLAGTSSFETSKG